MAADPASTRRPGGVTILVVTMAATAAVLHLFVQIEGSSGGGGHVHGSALAWLVIAMLFGLSEFFVVHLPTSRSSHTHTFSDVPVVLALTFLSPGQYLIGLLLGSGIAFFIQRRMDKSEKAFNLALYSLQAAVAVIVYDLVIGGARPDDPRGWGAALVAVVLMDLVGTVLVTIVIKVAGDGFDPAILRESVKSGVAAAVANSTLALVFVVLLVERRVAVPLLLGVLVVLVLVYRAYGELARRHTQTRSLYRFVADTVQTVDPDLALAGLLTQTRELLGAGRAELLLPSPGGTIRLTMSDSAGVAEEGISPAEFDAWAERVAAGAVVTSDGQLAAAVGMGDDRVAVLLVGARLFDADPFTPDDLALLSALAGHAGGVLQRADLVQRLRAQVVARDHEARHDPLTGLPNRRDLDGRFPLDAVTGEGALLLLGLDHFRQINDTLGHRAGDEVLREVGRRLQECDVGPVARLGGDEFVVLRPGAAGANTAAAAAAALLSAVRRPMVVGGVDVMVAASIGIAEAPDHGIDVDILLAHADLAMAAAKSSGVPVVVYQPTDKGVRRRRLQLAVDLGPALASGAVTPWFQPQIDARSGRLIGVEALVRWTHPSLGLVMPEDILPVAISTGLQRRMTDHVLAAALHNRASWRGPWRGARVSVNVSPRDLIDENLPRVLAALLAASGVAPAALTIEVTEEAFISDVRRCLEVLDALSDMGVRLSVDDFGTGYSSLAYLQRLPVQEVKIDKSFVWRFEDTGDTTVIQAVVDLAHALGMTVVVEGVEHDRTWQVMRELGVDVGQGWLFGRPRPLESPDEAHGAASLPRQIAGPGPVLRPGFAILGP